MTFAKWETKENMEKGLPLNKVNRKSEIKQSGLPMAYDEEYLYTDSKFSHSLVIGSTGSGKTQTITLPMLEMASMAGENVIVQDNMGELYEHTKKLFIDKGYNVIRLNFNNSDESMGWNPFMLPYKLYKEGNIDKAMDLIEDLVYYLLVDEHDFGGDDFWINSVIDYFTGLILYSFENNTEVTFKSLYDLDDYIRNNHKEFLEKVDTNSNSFISLKTTLLAPTDTRGSILALFSQKFRRYVLRSNLLDKLSSNDFDISDFADKKTVVYVSSSHAGAAKHLLSLLIKQIYDVINFKGNEKKISIILDEFSDLMPIKDFDVILKESRSIGIMFTVMIRSLKDLVMMYPKDIATNIRYNFANQVYLLSPDAETLEVISRECGITEIVDGHEIPLVTVEELKTFKIYEAIILVPRMYPFRTKLIPYYAIKD